MTWGCSRHSIKDDSFAFVYVLRRLEKNMFTSSVLYLLLTIQLLQYFLFLLDTMTRLETYELCMQNYYYYTLKTQIKFKKSVISFWLRIFFNMWTPHKKTCKKKYWESDLKTAHRNKEKLCIMTMRRGFEKVSWNIFVST